MFVSLTEWKSGAPVPLHREENRDELLRLLLTG